MTLAPEFSHQEHLQSTIRSWMNREVRDFFIDLGGDEWDEDITTPRASLRVACTHLDTDSLLMTQLRWNLFERVRLQRIQVPYFAIPISGFDEARKYKPQITLYFQEDLQDVETGYAPVTGEISFRLMGYETDTITPTIAQTFATRIETNFGTAGGFVWRKGRTLCSYTDKSKGYAFQILCRDDTYARTLISQVLDIQNHTPDWARLKINTAANETERYPIIPPTERVYGQNRRLPRARPIADVRFQVALLKVHGLQNAIPLFDRTGLYPSSLSA